MPALSDPNAPGQGNNGTIQIYQGYHRVNHTMTTVNQGFNQFQITELPPSGNFVLPYGGYRIDHLGSYDHWYATLQIDGMLFDTTTNTVVQPGQTLNFGTIYVVVNVFRIINMLDRNDLLELVRAYVQRRGLLNIFVEEIGNPSVFPWDFQQIRNYVPILYFIDNYQNLSPEQRSAEAVTLLNHFAEAYGLGLPDTRLDTRQLMVLLLISSYLEKLPVEVTQLIREQIDIFRHCILGTNVIEYNWNQDVHGLYGNRDVKNKIEDNLANVTSRP
jgi:hypothetical protein